MTPRYFPHNSLMSTAARWAACALVAATITVTPARAQGDGSFLASLKDAVTVASTVPSNGDGNPYGVVVAPVSVGKIHRGDILVSNWNNSGNLQGLGTTIVAVDPATHRSHLFAGVPRHLPGCPGGVGLSTSLTMLRSGYVIVGSVPSNDGTADTVGAGCLIVFDAQGTFVRTLVGHKIDAPWSNIALVDHGSSAALFVTMLNQAHHRAEDDGSKQGSVLRLSLAIGARGPVITGETVVASGFLVKPDKDVLIIGPTGLALDRRGTLYVSDANGNSLVAIADAVTRKTSAGTGREITKDGLMKRPLAISLAPNGHVLSLNGSDGRVVEIDPASGKQVVARWINTNKAQSPPGNGNLFGLAMTLDGSGFYFVNDDVNQLALSQ